jgi:RimJ/RimL family protein N-acetyltransferase
VVSFGCGMALSNQHGRSIAIPTLTTERLILRPFRDDDLDAYAEICADAKVMR